MTANIPEIVRWYGFRSKHVSVVVALTFCLVQLSHIRYIVIQIVMEEVSWRYTIISTFLELRKSEYLFVIRKKLLEPRSYFR